MSNYLLDPVNAIWAGAAYIRMGYHHGSLFDLPQVGSAYNSGTKPKRRDQNGWGLKFFDGYVENAAPMANVAAALFNLAELSSPPSSPPRPLPRVRLMR